MLTIVQNQVGASIRLRLTDQDGQPVSLAGYTTLEILARPERGAVKQWAAAPVGADADGVLEHVTAAGDLAEFGRWSLQPHLITATVDLRGTPVEVQVEVALDA